MRDFDIALPEDVFQGKTTDIYFMRTEEVLRKSGIDKVVTMEVAQKGMPNEYPFGVVTGLSHVLKLLEGKPVDVYAIPEGSIFYENTPVVTIIGKYLDFGIHETSILGFLCHTSGITTKALRCKLAAGDKTVLSFGARRAHPAISGVIDKYAYLGGCDGFSVMLAEDFLGVKASGTVPHALILLVGDTVKAMKLFDMYIDPSVKRMALVDTFNDEKFETIKIAYALKDKLDSVRLDTPGSRRGDLKKIAEEIRWELDLRGYQEVKIFASGGIDEIDITNLRQVIDGFGVGTKISNARIMDFSMDIVEIESQPFSKKGKMSAFKYVISCPKCLHQIFVADYKQLPRCPTCNINMVNLTKKYMDKGKILIRDETTDSIRERIQSQRLILMDKLGY